YLNRPDLTAEKFIPNPFSGGGARMYKTGDLARYLPASRGSIEYLGRIDHQIKIRGLRIELGEIEAALASLPEVREAVVVAREDQSGITNHLVAYLASQAGHTLPETPALRSRLAQSLPEYMIPSAFVCLERLPLTPNGKIDRRALPAPDMTRSETGYVAPRTATEEILAGIWAGVLGLKRVGVHDNFFELGGHSLLSLRIIAQAGQAGLKLTPRQFFQYQTIAELVAHAEEQVLPSEQGIITGEMPLTPGQARFFRKAIPDPHWWNLSNIFKVNRTRVDAGLLEQAVWHVLLHHDALRARFVCDETGWRQIIAFPEETANPFSYIDLSAVPREDRERVADSTKNEVQQSLNLSKGPLIRVVMLDLGTMRNQLLMVAHHLVMDGFSFEIVIEDMFTAYQQLADGKQVQLPPKTTSLKAWAERTYQYAQSPDFERQLDKWLALPWAQTAPLPVDYPEGRATNIQGSLGLLWASLSVDETAILLKDVPKVYGAQVVDALIMALVESIAGWTGNPWVTITMIKSGRMERIPGTERMDLTRTVGWLAMEEILLLEHRKVNHPGEALESIKGQLRGLRGDSLLIDMAGLSRQYEKKAPFPGHLKDVSFNYNGKNAQSVIEVSGIQYVPLFNGNTQNDACPIDEVFGFLGTISGNRLVWYWHYGKTVYERATAEKIAASFTAALRALIAHCQSASKENFTQDVVK
ncbi:MAG: condensation domain-containing protein, partial [Anaerolineales bacterium]